MVSRLLDRKLGLCCWVKGNPHHFSYIISRIWVRQDTQCMDKSGMNTSATAIPLMDTTPVNSVDYGSTTTEGVKSEVMKQNPVMKILNNAFDDALSYISEYGLLKLTPEVKEKRAELSAAINEYDVVVVAKEGCGFCERAKKMLSEAQTEGLSFTKHIIIGTDRAWRHAVGSSLNLGDLTFPQLIIRGVYVGGCDNLRDGISRGLLPVWISREAVPSFNDQLVTWEPELLQEALTPKIFHVATVPFTKAKWYSKFYLFNWHLYSNLVRYISLFHVICFVLLLILYKPMKSDNSSAELFGNIVFLLLSIDLLMLVIFGPSPFSMSGCLATYFGWKYKGNVTSAVPYKVVFASYLFSLLPLVVGKDASLSSGTALGVYLGSVVNSTVLVVFRF
jgi:glutaredoxin